MVTFVYCLRETCSDISQVREHLMSSHFVSKRNAFRNGGRGVAPISDRKMTVRTFSGCVQYSASASACARPLQTAGYRCVLAINIRCRSNPCTTHAGYSEVSNVTPA